MFVGLPGNIPSDARIALDGEEGEVLVIPVPSGASIEQSPTPTAFVEVETKPPEPDPWSIWWAVFFDSPPP